MVTLKNILRANAASCLGFGTVFIIAPAYIAHFLGSPAAPDITLIILGVVLVFNGLHLLWASSKSSPSERLIIYFSSGDFLWVIATLFLILVGLWITTTSGIIAAIAVAVVVGAFGLLQLVKRNELGNS